MAEFVIIYKRKSGESLIEQFSDLTQALKERLRREAAIDDFDIEIAHISAPSLESLKKSHSRYFMGKAKLEGGQKGSAPKAAVSRFSVTILRPP
ncbi:hypothetical protein [Corynebacterium sp. HMSC074H12]|uniref:hypothetical protein n=1 Tax=Corynebacterium sp. HMSC074H12 TaxID=1739436 RepID=UPI000A5F11A4|nr:hypothetical protein [Corynebacterium sp. HMSC074H12]